MSWNVVLNAFIDIKYLVPPNIRWQYDPSQKTCFEHWCEYLNDPTLNKLSAILQFNEYGNSLLIRYGKYGSAEYGENDITYDNMWDFCGGILKECRSVVIDIVNDCLILTPFRKFFNINETKETSYENISKRISKATTVEFSDKLDGSMQSARFYNGKIIMAGSQALNRDASWRLNDGYNMIHSDCNYEKMLSENPDKTFIFEFISKEDAHVVVYDKEGLFLIGVREVETGREWSYREILNIAKKYNIYTTKVFDKTLDEVMSELDDKKSNEAEGFVLNIDGYKVKIKYNDYVNIHRILSKASSVNLIIQSIAENTFDDLYSKLPIAYRKRVLDIADTIFSFINKTDKDVNYWYDCAPKDDKKEFMIFVQTNVPKRLRCFVRNKYLGANNNYLISGGSYVKINYITEIVENGYN